MGSFSWIRSDYNIENLNQKANITYGDKIKLLIPQEFGGGFIEGTYEDYGIIYDYDGKEYDIYELVAIWNSKEIQQALIKKGFKNIKPIDNLTKHIRKFGIKIACYDSNQATLNEEEEKNKIMQYTGIEDSKGKEIYENDIVKILVESGYGDSYSQSEHICEVIYFGSGFYLKPINLSLSDESIISIEVIGNIYEKNKRIDLK